MKQMDRYVQQLRLGGWRRLVTTVATAMLLGAGANVAVAILIALRVPVGLGQSSRGSVVLASGERVPYLHWREPGIELLKWHWYMIRDDADRAAFPLIPAPTWSGVARRPAYNPRGAPFFVNVRCEVASGWPLRSLRWCYAVKDPPGTMFFEPPRGAIRLGDHSSPPTWHLARVRAVPLIPVWPSLLLGSLVYGALFLGPLLALGRVRALVRRRRKLCPRCGYSLAGLAEGGACPECGAMVQKS